VRLIEELLKKSSDISFDLESCTRLFEGLNSLKNKDFDIILLDLTLPDSDKESTIERFIDFTSKNPIIILTGLDDKELALNSLKKGFQDYLVKGELNTTVLIRSILYGIERHKIEYKKVKEKDLKIQLDDKDKIILNILQENYRISYKEISEKVNLAASTIHNRVQNMLKEGIIRKFDTFVDPFKVGYKTVAILGLSIEPLRLNNVAKELANYDETQLVTSSSGAHDMLLQVIAKNEKDLWRFINEKIKTIDGVKPHIEVSSLLDVFKMTNKILFKTENQE